MTLIDDTPSTNDEEKSVIDGTFFVIDGTLTLIDAAPSANDEEKSVIDGTSTRVDDLISISDGRIYVRFSASERAFGRKGIT